MIVLPPGSEPIAYMCPACGNYFCESAVQSYYSYTTAIFSDGMAERNYRMFWLTRCPRCGQYFAKKHLFRLPELFPRRSLARRPYVFRRDFINEKNFGYIDRCLDDDESELEFIEKALNKGLYFPVNITEPERKRYCILLHKELWHRYNLKRDDVNDDTYIAFCKKLIGVVEEDYVPDKLILAELYRNIGDFEKSLTLLEGVTANEENEKIVDCIREGNIKKNTKTVRITKERRKW